MEAAVTKGAVVLVSFPPWSSKVMYTVKNTVSFEGEMKQPLPLPLLLVNHSLNEKIIIFS